jgi:TRAP-type mannitol/chloroaromatic compound transport system permease small subunit
MSWVSAVDRLTTTLANTVRWLALAMVVVTLAIVVLRYAFASSAILLQESVMYMHGLLFMFGIPYGVLRNSHVRVDLVYARLSAKQQNWVDLSGHVLFLLPIAAFIFITSLPYVAASWRVWEGSVEVGGVPAVFLLKTLIPVMAALLFLQGISEIAKRIRSIRNMGTQH